MTFSASLTSISSVLEWSVRCRALIQLYSSGQSPFGTNATGMAFGRRYELSGLVLCSDVCGIRLGVKPELAF
jgi:hypothetical protein